MTPCQKFPYFACQPSGCGCVKYNPDTQVLTVNDEIVSFGLIGPPLVNAANLEGPLLNSGVQVPAASIVGTLPTSAIPCAAVTACLASLGPGSLPASAITPGVAAQVLTTNANGDTVWSALNAGQIATAMNSGAAVVSPATNAAIAQLYGESAAGGPIVATPMQIVEAAIAGASASTENAPIATVLGTAADGTATKAKVVEVGTVVAGTSAVAAGTTVTYLQNTSQIIASVEVPDDGLYAVSVDIIVFRTLTHAITTDATAITNVVTAATVNNGGLVLYHSGGLYPFSFELGTNYPAAMSIGESITIGTVLINRFTAGTQLDLKFYNASRGVGHDIDANFVAAPNIRLTKLADHDIVPMV
jgi:hypothetical protein